MSAKSAPFLIVILLAVMSSSFVFNKPRSEISQDYRQLKLEIGLDKKTYLPGEPIDLQVVITNNSNSNVSLYKGSTVSEGYLRIFIANEAGDYNLYLGPNWGARDIVYKEPFILLEPGKDFRTEATILWNHTISTSHLNPEAAKRVSQGRLKTEYALPKPGIYYIKASLSNPTTRETIESEPLRITVVEPLGVDLEVWNKIKDNGVYAHFLHTGEFRESSSDPGTKQVISTLEGIVASYPGSSYANIINNALAKHRSLLERLNKASNRPSN